jgi:hypothetical protein
MYSGKDFARTARTAWPEEYIRHKDQKITKIRLI